MRAFDPATTLALCSALVMSPVAPAAGAEIAAHLRYQLDASLTPASLEAEASGLARQFDWLIAHGYRLRLRGSVSRPEHPPRCGWVEVEFFGPPEAQALLLQPLLQAFAVDSTAIHAAAGATPALSTLTPTPRHTQGILKPESNLAELLALLAPTASCGPRP